MQKGTLVAYLAAGLVLTAAAAGTGRADPTEQARQASAAVATARDAVEAATQKRALWTTAQDALKQAEEALARQDYAAAERLAQFAAEQARFGIEQLGYPHFQ
jgi:hypothetical protein